MLAVAYGFDAKDFKSVQEMVKDFPHAIEMGLRDAVTIGMQKVIRRTPVDTGDARKSFGKPVRIGELTYTIVSDIGNGKNYTPFLEFGTGLYGPNKRAIKPPAGVTWRFPIVVKNTIKAWVTVGEGAKLKSLKGMKPRNMIRDTKKEMPKIIKDNINRVIQELIKRANGGGS